MSSDPLIVWSDPPPRRMGVGGGRPLKYGALVQAVKQRPGEWACVQRNETANPLYKVQNTLRRATGYQRLAAPGRIEATVRRTDGGDYGLWMRYVPLEQP